MQRVLCRIEILDALHKWRSNQRTIESISPGVIWAADRVCESPVLGLANACAAMAAHVMKGADGAVLPANEDNALCAKIPYEVIARRTNSLLTARADPATTKNPLL